MSGIGLVLNIAKDALFAQRGALDVVSHNIANVNTTGYSKQTPVFQAVANAPYAGKVFGRGVTLDEIIRNTDSFVEARLRDRQSELSAMSEEEVYLRTLEGIFDETNDLGLSSQLVNFWNAWYDLSNNPGGASEREVLCQRGTLLSQAFASIDTDLTEMEREITHSLSATLETVNQLTTKIAQLNGEILSMEVNGSANDLKDQRTEYVKELAGYLDIQAFEQEDGNLTITTGRGYTLVSRADSYSLSLDSDEITWQSSGSNVVNITDTIAGGKLGGWLEIRDNIIPSYQADMDEIAKNIIWEVNAIYSQGVGVKGFTTLTGTDAAINAAEELGTVDSGLDYYDKVQDGSFQLWLYDASGAVVGGGSTTVNITANATTLNGLAATLSAIDANLTATVDVNNRLVMTAANGYTFAFADDTSQVLSALGVNTFFSGSDAGNMAVNSVVSLDKDLLAAGRVGSDGAIAKGDNTNALALVNLQYESKTIKRWEYARGETPVSTDVNGTLNDYLTAFASSVGIASQSAQRLKEFQQSIYNQLTDMRDNVASVSLDEEMTDLIKYQHAYTAAAKLVTTADQMLETLVNIKSTT